MEKNLDCDINTPICSSKEWKGTNFDTTFYNAGKIYYYNIRQVKGLNTEKQEYSIYLNDAIYSVSSNQKAYFATISDGSSQRIYSIEKGYDKNTTTQSNDNFIVKDDIFREVEGNIGFPVYLSINHLIIASTQSNNFPNSDKKQLLPVEATIGQSRLYEVNDTKLNKVKTELPNINQHLIWESQPAYDKKNNILFFTSDRPGGYGGVDIWYMIGQGENWSEPINCGSNVNSTCDDITPFASMTTQKLYFSTEARDNVGGYDIFSVDYTFDHGTLQFNSEPKNLGSPINTQFDEISPNFPDYSDNYFYYSSDQDGDYDIYILEKIFKTAKDSIRYKKEEVKPDEKIDIALKKDTLEVEQMFNLEGVVKDNRTNEPIENIDVTVKKDKEKIPHKTTKTNEQGKYKFELVKGHEYSVEVKNDTLFNDSYKVFVANNDTNSTVNRDLVLDIKKTVRINFKYDQSDEPYEYILDSLGNQINTTWQEAIENLADDIKESLPLLDKVIITGYTDPVGSNSYNLNLGQKRAEFVMAKLVEKGIPIYILKAKTKGETEKLVKFDNEDENQYHKRLRRVTLEKVFIK